MKKILLTLILLSSPLMAQEKKDLYIETGIFTRIEGISIIDIGLKMSPYLVTSIKTQTQIL